MIDPSRLVGVQRLALLLMIAMPGQAKAQETALPSPPEAKLEDENGVDVASGIVRLEVADVSMGPITHNRRSIARPKSYAYGIPPNGAMVDSNDLGIGIVFQENWSSNTFWDYRTKFTVNVGAAGEDFFINTDGSLEATKGGTLDHGTDAVLTFACGSWGIWTYRSATGVVATIDMKLSGGGDGEGSPGSCGRVLQVSEPNGVITRYTYDVPLPNAAGGGWARLKSVNRNDGFQLKYRWNGTTLLGVNAVNNAYEYCSPTSDSCTLSGTWPSSSYAWESPSVYAVTDQAGRVARFTVDRHHRIVAYKPYNAATDQVTYQYCARDWYWDPWNNGQYTTPTSAEALQQCTVMISAIAGGTPDIQLTVTHDRARLVTNGGKNWTYNFPSGSYGPYYYNYTSSAQDGRGTYALTTSLGTGALLVYGSDQATLNFENSSRNRVISGQVRGQPAKTITYDARDNVTSDGVITAGFVAVCTNLVTCNKPIWVRDVAGNQTDYTYDPVHGGVLTVTGPAVQVNGSGPTIRPQKRYTYVQRHAWFKNSAGVMTRSTEPIWLVASEAFCRTSGAVGAGCATAGDEVITTFEYGPDSGPNNLLLRGKAVTADGQTLRSCVAYDQYGNSISETAPRANLTVCP